MSQLLRTLLRFNICRLVLFFHVLFYSDLEFWLLSNELRHYGGCSLQLLLCKFAFWLVFSILSDGK